MISSENTQSCLTNRSVT